MLVASLCLKQFGLFNNGWPENRWQLLNSDANPTATTSTATTTAATQQPITTPPASHHRPSTSSDEPRFNFHKLAESATKDKVKKKSRPKKEYICRYVLDLVLFVVFFNLYVLFRS